ncbi:hypothetical protein BH23THE1_BH23THE1_30060 [soil metagenome]
MYLGGLGNEIDSKVYSVNTSYEINKLYSNLTPGYLGSKDFDINGEVRPYW